MAIQVKILDIEKTLQFKRIGRAQLRTTNNNSWSQLLSNILSNVNTLTWILLNLSCYLLSNIKSSYIILKC